MGYQCCWLTALISIERVVWKIEYQSTESLIKGETHETGYAFVMRLDESQSEEDFQ